MSDGRLILAASLAMVFAGIWLLAGVGWALLITGVLLGFVGIGVWL